VHLCGHYTFIVIVICTVIIVGDLCSCKF